MNEGCRMKLWRLSPSTRRWRKCALRVFFSLPRSVLMMTKIHTHTQISSSLPLCFHLRIHCKLRSFREMITFDYDMIMFPSTANKKQDTKCCLKIRKRTIWWCMRACYYINPCLHPPTALSSFNTLDGNGWNRIMFDLKMVIKKQMQILILPLWMAFLSSECI